MNNFTYHQFKNIAQNLYLAEKELSLQKLRDLTAGVVSEELLQEYKERWEQENLDLPNEAASKEDQELIQKLEYSLSLTRATLESTADAILLVDKSGKLIDWNSKFVEFSKIPKHILEKAEENVGLDFMLTQVKDPVALGQSLAEISVESMHAKTKGNFGEIEMNDGRFIERYTKPLVLNDDILGRVWSFRDITERKKSEQAILLKNRAINQSSIGTIIIENNEALSITSTNPSFCNIFGYEEQQVMQMSALDFFQEIEMDGKMILFEQALRNTSLSLSFITKNTQKNKNILWLQVHTSPVYNHNKDVTHYVILSTDITEQRLLQEQLSYAATHDSLTGLPNRHSLFKKLRKAIQFAERANSMFSLWFFDIDQFKLINDSLGHYIGDKVLQALSKKLQRNIRTTDILARISGDEFILVCLRQKSQEDNIPILNKIIQVIKEPIKVDDYEINLSVSIGISCYPNDGRTPEELLMNADTAMYYKKAGGRDGFKFFNQEMNHTLHRKMKINNLIHKAVEKNELTLHYQPIVDLASGTASYAESLLRWHNEELGGNVSPADFIPVIENTNAIHYVGNWILETAIAQCKKWRSTINSYMCISVNVAVRQFYDRDLHATIRGLLQKYDLPPNALTIEITEGVLIDQTDQVMQTIEKLRHTGVKLSLDDFGTGYSSLSYLKDFPIDYLKIDKSFVDNIGYSLTAEAILEAIMLLSKNLKIKVVAEGVETKQQLEFLRENNCDLIQGYYYSPPCTYDKCNAIIKADVIVQPKAQDK